MKIRLSDHFTCRRLLRFTLPSIVMMIFTSIYGVVDGLFVSNFVGKTPFAAINPAPCSPIISDAALVLADVIFGITEASTTERPVTPRTSRFGLVTAIASLPILQVPQR